MPTLIIKAIYLWLLTQTTKENADYYLNNAYLGSYDIGSAFVWDDTPQGGQFWSKLSYLYDNVIDKDPGFFNYTPKGNRLCAQETLLNEKV